MTVYHNVALICIFLVLKKKVIEFRYSINAAAMVKGLHIPQFFLLSIGKYLLRSNVR